jgi:hypothetical protein
MLMERRLATPIIEEELWSILEAMVKGKTPGPNGVIMEFFFYMWSITCKEYMKMIQDSIVNGNDLLSVMRRLITLLHKGGKKKQLSNWKPITLLNVTYKSFANALQMWMELVLMETINQDQLMFFPFKFILNNILLTHGTIAWAKKSKKLLVYLKLEFSKAYDKVDWSFLFDRMDKFGIPIEFVKMMKVLFQGANSNIAVNGKTSKALVIKRGV